MSQSDRSTIHVGGRVGFLLIHGLGGTPLEMRFVAHGLARHGYTVMCCQLAGHCGTVAELRNSTWQQWYASVEAALERLKQHCDVVIAGGLSMGGLLAAMLARNRPQDVHGLVFYAPTLWLNGWSMPWYAFVLRYIRPTPLRLEINLAEHEPYGLKDERIRSFVVKSMLSGDSSEAGVFCTPVRAFAQFNSMLAVIKPGLGAIDVPALIVHPRHDDMADIDNAFYLQRRLGGPVEMVVLEDSYHIITLDRQRHVVVDRSHAFAGQLASRRAEKASAIEVVQVNAAE